MPRPSPARVPAGTGGDVARQALWWQDRVVHQAARGSAVMLAKAVDELPAGGGWAFEAKLDGFRATATVGGDGRLRLLSRHHKRLDAYFPELVEARQGFGPGTVIDGEIIVAHDGGVDFLALQRRLNPSARRARQLAVSSPAGLVAFDLLALAGKSTRHLPYDERRAQLTALLALAPPPLGLMPMTDDAASARIWLAGGRPGVEGVVAKRLAQPYRGGVRDWCKIRARSTVEAVVGGVFGPVYDPTALILGLPDRRGRLGIAGRTATLPRAARRLVGPLLRAARDNHPWPAEVPASRFGSLAGGDRIGYTAVDPRLVVEIEADTAFELGRWRHPTRFVRARYDLAPDDLGPIAGR